MKASRTAATAFAVLCTTAVAQDGGDEKKPLEPPPIPAPVPPPKPPDPPVPPPPLFEGTPQDLAGRHANVTIREIGRSRGGRALVLVSVLPPGGREEDVEWAALVVAGLCGLRDRDETKLALDIAARVAAKEGGLPPRCAVRVLLDGTPDATAWTQGARVRAGNDLAVDEDQDGDLDEDGPDDLDGD